MRRQNPNLHKNTKTVRSAFLSSGNHSINFKDNHRNLSHPVHIISFETPSSHYKTDQGKDDYSNNLGW